MDGLNLLLRANADYRRELDEQRHRVDAEVAKAERYREELKLADQVREDDLRRRRRWAAAVNEADRDLEFSLRLKGEPAAAAALVRRAREVLAVVHSEGRS